ncbi:GntR family transcriptional regulator [Sphingomonas sp. Root710]|uniref:GntR family transcriptional regulator n=1 Tax=Sphingomonas sp. Root710 TaxID=1736594 RepID=UPI000AE895F5|nr:GntR family transcriptional regulator [Sphingomonas sp. Root710]
MMGDDGHIPAGDSGPHSTGTGGDDHSPFDRAYRGILRGLYEGTLVPGQRLIAPDLMQRFDVGRGTVREVLHRLASSGVVSIIPNRGAAIRQLTRREVAGVLDIVEVLLGLAARGAAVRLGPGEDRDKLLALHARLQQVNDISAFSDFLSAREEYYRHIVRLSCNGELRRIFPDTQIHIMRIQLRTFGLAADAFDPDDFTALTEALLAGEPHAAEEAGKRHVDLTRNRIIRLPARAFAPEK